MMGSNRHCGGLPVAAKLASAVATHAPAPLPLDGLIGTARPVPDSTFSAQAGRDVVAATFSKRG